MISIDKINTAYQDTITSFVLNRMLHHVGILWINKTHEIKILYGQTSFRLDERWSML